MSVTDWIAIIGALAWAPQIVTWIRDYLAKPRLTLFPAPAAEIGFSTFGTVLNLTCAISAAVDDAVIERMEADLTHENGQRFTLPWRNLHENIAEIETVTGEVERHRRQQTALALKVATVELAEQIILFQDAEFQKRLIGAAAALENRRDHAAKHVVGEDLEVALLKSDEFAHLEQVVRSGMCWQEGTYDVVFRAKIAERRAPFEFRYRFHLTATDIARLRDNIEGLVRLLTSGVMPSRGSPTYTFQWRYPSMLAASTGGQLTRR